VKAKAEGKVPFFINATAGTTVLGAYDPLHEIADIAKKYGIWAHLDACWGGHALLSKKHRHLMNGCEKVFPPLLSFTRFFWFVWFCFCFAQFVCLRFKFDSIAWTATKCLGLPQQCAALLMKEEHILTKCNAMGKDYLFHEHEEKDWDLGEKTLNCGRRVDALKLWISWKVFGDKGFEERVNHAFSQAQHMTEQILKQKDKFKLLAQPESLNVCFWYIPPSARQLPDGPEKDKKLDHATVTIRHRMQREGKVLVNYSDLHGYDAHFFRMITCNPGATPADMDFVLSEIDRLGSDL
jgi:glutamate/tyrosine decarboxylase-like PLP-dependent enzyme